MLKNTNTQYGWLAIILHWLMAVLIVCLFALGQWMTGLEYYDTWYTRAPWWHKSIGMLVCVLWLLRLVWRKVSPPPAPLPSHKLWQVAWAHRLHLGMYGLLLVIFCSGYLISTADGRAIEVFGWVSIPASITSIPQQADVAGWVHKVTATVLMALAALHAGAALKHHFIDKDTSLMRMLGRDIEKEKL